MVLGRALSVGAATKDVLSTQQRSDARAEADHDIVAENGRSPLGGSTSGSSSLADEDLPAPEDEHHQSVDDEDVGADEELLLIKRAASPAPVAPPSINDQTPLSEDPLQHLKNSFLLSNPRMRAHRQLVHTARELLPHLRRHPNLYQPLQLALHLENLEKHLVRVLSENTLPRPLEYHAYPDWDIGIFETIRAVFTSRGVRVPVGVLQGGSSSNEQQGAAAPAAFSFSHGGVVPVEGLGKEIVDELVLQTLKSQRLEKSRGYTDVQMRDQWGFPLILDGGGCHAAEDCGGFRERFEQLVEVFNFTRMENQLSAATKGEQAVARSVRERFANERISEAVKTALGVGAGSSSPEAGSREKAGEEGRIKNPGGSPPADHEDDLDAAMKTFRRHVKDIVGIASDHWLPQRMIRDMGLPNALRARYLAELRRKMVGAPEDSSDEERENNVEKVVLEIYDRVTKDLSERIKAELTPGVKSRVID